MVASEVMAIYQYLLDRKSDGHPFQWIRALEKDNRAVISAGRSRKKTVGFKGQRRDNVSLTEDDVHSFQGTDEEMAMMHPGSTAGSPKRKTVQHPKRSSPHEAVSGSRWISIFQSA